MTSSVAVADTAVIAEFGDRLYVSSRRPQAETHVETDFYPDHAVVRERSITILCDCGKSATIPISARRAKPAAWRYSRLAEEPPSFHLAIIRTELSEPICEHWVELPLAFKEAE